MPKTISPVHVNVGFAPGVRDTDLLWRAELRSGVGLHEIAILDFRKRAGDVAPPDGSLVTVRFGATAKWSKVFYGYVNHTERVDTSSAKSANTYRVFCIGTSKVMNNPNPDRWSGVTGSFIARSTAERYRFRSVLSKSAAKLNWVQSASETDFAMMNRLAEKCGMFFWVSGSTMNFVDPAHRIVTAASNTVQTFTRTFPALQNPTDTLRDMYLIRGVDAPGMGAKTVAAYGLDPYTGLLLKSTSTRAYNDAGLSVPTTSTIHPGTISSGAEGASVTDTGIFASTWAKMSADVWVRDVPVYVGDIVNLDGTAVNSTDQGLWFVSGTLEVMEFHNDTIGYDYTANLTLTRNQTGTHVTKSTKNLTGGAPVVPAVWLNGRWQSRTLESIYV